MAKSMQSKITAAIKDIRRFHNLGWSCLQKFPGRAEYGKRQLENEAEKSGRNPFTLRKARQFAEGYTDDDVEELCLQIKGQSNHRGAIFGKSHLLRLLAVPKSKRASVQADAIRHGWTFQRLSAEISQKLGRRRAGGKRPRIPKDLIGVYDQIESRCLSWQRWKMDLFNLLEGPKKRENSIANMAKGIRTLLENATKLLDQLYTRVSAELGEKRPGRKLVVESDEARMARKSR